MLYMISPTKPDTNSFKKEINEKITKNNGNFAKNIVTEKKIW